MTRSFFFSFLLFQLDERAAAVVRTDLLFRPAPVDARSAPCLSLILGVWGFAEFFTAMSMFLALTELDRFLLPLAEFDKVLAQSFICFIVLMPFDGVLQGNNLVWPSWIRFSYSSMSVDRVLLDFHSTIPIFFQFYRIPLLSLTWCSRIPPSSAPVSVSTVFLFQRVHFFCSNSVSLNEAPVGTEVGAAIGVVAPVKLWENARRKLHRRHATY